MEEWIAIYKGLRLPVLGLLLSAIAVYVFWPSRKKRLEEPAKRMLEDLPPGRSETNHAK
ncbi:MAG: cbb3-type cytochrome c oxidase subunit 3 [Spirochaetia bacterium]|nr:cbb3-type cytochrome c oxidase subunit 3 [Spirochaetia bacterium]